MPGRVARRSDERDSSDSTSRAVSTGDLAALARRHQAQRDHEVEAAPTPATAIKQASEIQRATIQDQKRGKRNITIQKYMVTAGLVAVKYEVRCSPQRVLANQSQHDVYLFILVVVPVLLHLSALHLLSPRFELHYDCFNYIF